MPRLMSLSVALCVSLVVACVVCVSGGSPSYPCSAQSVAQQTNSPFFPCSTFAEGTTCTYNCPTGTQLTGGHFACESNGELAGAQSCVAPTAGANVFTILSTAGESRLTPPVAPVNAPGAAAPRAAQGLAYCPTSGLLVMVGGFSESQGEASVLTSTDGVNWVSRGDLVVSATTYAMWATQAVCDLEDRFYLLGGRQEGGSKFTNFEFSTTITETGALTWQKRTAEFTPRAYHSAIMVPSSEFADILVMAGKIPTTMTNDVWRYKASARSWSEVCGPNTADCGFGIRNSPAVAYVDQLLVMVGGFWADSTDHNVAEEVWISRNDGVTWSLQSSTNTALTSTTRIRSSLWAYGRILYHAFDGVNSGQSKFSQSADFGKTWTLVSDDHAPLFPRGDVGHVVMRDSLIAVGGEGPSGAVADQTVALRVGSVASLEFTDSLGAPISFNNSIMLGQMFRYQTSLPNQKLIFVEIVLNNPAQQATIAVNGHFQQPLHSSTLTKVYLHPGQTNLVRIGTAEGSYSFYFTDYNVPLATTTLLRIPDVGQGGNGPSGDSSVTATCTPNSNGETNTQVLKYDPSLGVYELAYTSSTIPQDVNCVFTRPNFAGFRLPKKLYFYSGPRGVLGFQSMPTSLTPSQVYTGGASYLSVPLGSTEYTYVGIQCTPSSLLSASMTKTSLTPGGYDSATWTLTADAANSGVATCQLTAATLQNLRPVHFLPSPPVKVVVGSPASFSFLTAPPSSAVVGTSFKVSVFPSTAIIGNDDEVRVILRCSGDSVVSPTHVDYTHSDGVTPMEFTITAPSSVGLEHKMFCTTILTGAQAYRYIAPNDFSVLLNLVAKARGIWKQRVRAASGAERFEVDDGIQHYIPPPPA